MAVDSPVSVSLQSSKPVQMLPSSVLGATSSTATTRTNGNPVAKTTLDTSSLIGPDYTELMQMATSLLSGCVPASSPAKSVFTPNTTQLSSVSSNGHISTSQPVDQSANETVKEEVDDALGATNFLSNDHCKVNRLTEMHQQHTITATTAELRNDVKLFSPNMPNSFSASKKCGRNALISSDLNFSPINMHQPTTDQCKS